MAQRKLANLLERGDTASARLSAEFQRRNGTPGGHRGEEQLGTDARYRAYLSGPGRLVNANLLDACDRISVFLCASLPSPFEIEVQSATGETETITFETVDDTTWRVHPWPLQGERLRHPVRRAPIGSLVVRFSLEEFSGDDDARTNGSFGLHPVALVGCRLTFAGPMPTICVCH